MEAGWSAWLVAHQLGRSDCVMRKCWDQWIREMSFTQRPGSVCHRQTSHQENRHIVRNARVQPNASSTAIQAQVAPSLGAPVPSRTIRRCLDKGHLVIAAPIIWTTLDAYPTTHPFGVVPRTRKLESSKMEPGSL
ncbi:uncharacterized protein TNCV_4884531 [Trichonephila clavipes]|nr:uncharacterized protein TNCV_4884531 [Trichonephila clavipes]